MKQKQDFTALGLMSGTSMDGIDVALVHTNGTDKVTWETGRTYPYPETLTAELFRLLQEPERARREPLTHLEEAVTDAHRDAVTLYFSETGWKPSTIDIIGFHGQTVLHRPKERFTRQLGNGQRLADDLRIPVVAQFRQADVASGGEGAPLVPVFHQALASHMENPTVVLNLGGVANITYIDGETLLAFDTGPAGALVDDYMRQHFGLSFDENGQLAAQGTEQTNLIHNFLADVFFSEKPPKSLDRNNFHKWYKTIEHLSPADAIATLTAYTVESIIISQTHMPKVPRQWLITGGGRKNRYIIDCLKKRLKKTVLLVENVGWDGDFLEAQAFAYLAVRHIINLPLSFPQTTNVPVPMCGGILYHPSLSRTLSSS